MRSPFHKENSGANRTSEMNQAHNLPTPILDRKINCSHQRVQFARIQARAFCAA